MWPINDPGAFSPFSTCEYGNNHKTRVFPCPFAPPWYDAVALWRTGMNAKAGLHHHWRCAGLGRRRVPGVAVIWPAVRCIAVPSAVPSGQLRVGGKDQPRERSLLQDAGRGDQGRASSVQDMQTVVYPGVKPRAPATAS